MKQIVTSSTVKHIRATELSSDLRQKFNVTPKQLLNITVVVEKKDKEINIGDDLVEGFKEIAESNKKGSKLPRARNLLKEL